MLPSDPSRMSHGMRTSQNDFATKPERRSRQRAKLKLASLTDAPSVEGKLAISMPRSSKSFRPAARSAEGVPPHPLFWINPA